MNGLVKVSVVSAVIALAIVAMYFGPIHGSHEDSKKLICISNLKQISSAMQLYLDDSNGRFPPQGWQSELMPYTRNADLCSCPKIPSEKHGQGYAMNVSLMGVVAATITEPELMPMFFETDALGVDVLANYSARSRTRHGKGTVGVRVNGLAYFEEAK